MEPENTPNLARQALDNLVHQFARPMDFLRELVQNSIDAGSPRIEIWLRYQADHGVLEVHVDDFGEGMDEAIVDQQLTRMFSSNKEGDLTKIGKFGIGFTSVFAIGPEAVLVHTGRHGEAWELLFHADRSFDKTRLDQPVTGTHITIFEQLPPDRVPAFVQKARWVLQYWCRHSDTPITFSDRTQAQPEESVEHADPFAAFADGGTTTGPSTPVGDPETINEPMLLDSPLQVELQTDGVRVVAGYSDAPSFGYYNGGLTLIETGNPEVLGVYEQRLGHIGFKVKYDALEHTLTRDNVLHDESWTHAMAVVQRASLELRRLLMDKLTAESEAGRDLRRWHGLLALECRATAFHQDRPDFDDRCVFRDSGGRRVTLAELSRAEDDLGAVLLDGGGKALEDAVMAKGYPVLPDQPEVRDLLEASFEPSGLPFGRKERRIASVGHVFGLAWPLEPAQLSRSEQRLLEEVQQLLRLSAGRGVHVAVGEFQGTQAKATDPLALEGPMEGGLFRRLEPKLLRAPLFIRKRYVLLDRHHPTFNALLLAAQEDLHVAACSLGQLLLDAADVRATAPFREILQHAWERSHGVGS